MRLRSYVVSFSKNDVGSCHGLGIASLGIVVETGRLGKVLTELSEEGLQLMED
jgi:hypothetical protein